MTWLVFKNSFQLKPAVKIKAFYYYNYYVVVLFSEADISYVYLKLHYPVSPYEISVDNFPQWFDFFIVLIWIYLNLCKYLHIIGYLFKWNFMTKIPISIDRIHSLLRHRLRHREVIVVFWIYITNLYLRFVFNLWKFKWVTWMVWCFFIVLVWI